MKKDFKKCRRLIISDESVRREAVLRFKVDKLEEQINVYWKQRAHIQCLFSKSLHREKKT
jgi:hypothetical protein